MVTELTPTTDTPTTFIIFGITGDLAQRKLLPALLSLYVKKLLPRRFAVVGFGRRPFTRQDFRQFIREEMNIKSGQYKEEDVKHFIDHILYEQGNFSSLDSYSVLSERLQAIDNDFKQCSNKLFHLSVPPTLYETILLNLAESGLTIPCSGKEGWTRVLVEKPFGSDVETAQALDELLGNLFDEKQIFRIDHYLAKETMQNILAFRFANSLFEPLWSFRHIEKVEVKLLEKDTINGRGEFYDNTGALKDVGQNHILQMLALVAMEQPEYLDSESIREGRAKVLHSLNPINHRNIHLYATRGQYEGYRSEDGVSPGSQTETYFKLETYLDHPRWKDVPFYLESGKALDESKVSISVYFKNPDGDDNFNVLTFKIQPHEGIEVRFLVKTPGFGMLVEPKTLKFNYSDFGITTAIPDAYEKVIYDAVIGDQTLFTSTEEVLVAWNFISPIIDSWSRVPLKTYKKGSKEVK